MTLQPGNTSDYVTAAVASALVLIGWIVLYRQSVAIKRREELTGQVRLAAEQIDSILSKCSDYYSATNSDHIGHLSAQIKGEIHLLSRYIAILKLIGLELSVTEEFIRLKMLATGSHFETVDFLNQLKIPNWEEELTFCAFDLRYKIESAFFRWSSWKVRRGLQT